MKLPNKIISYKESVLSRFPLVLSVLSDNPMNVYELFELTKDSFTDVEEFMDTLECLYALKKVTFDDESGVLFYAVWNILRKVSSTKNYF